MKIKKALIVLLCVLSMGLFYGCVNNARISFENTDIEMIVGQEIELSSILKIENCSLEDLTFSTSNNQIVFISPTNKLIARGSGAAIIEAKVSSKTTYLNVKVTPQKEKFQKVTGLEFDYEHMCIKWNPAFVYDNQNVVFASSYEVKIINGENTSSQTIIDNQLKLTEPGNYRVSVKAKNSSYLESDFSDEISFEILDRVQNLVYNDETGVLSWDEIEDCDYTVEVDGILTNLKTNFCNLNLQKAQEYLIKVRAKNENAFGEATEKILIRLNTPSLSVSNGILNYDISQANLGATYKLAIKTSVGQTQYVQDNSGSYKFDEFEYGQYYVSVQALGNGQELLSSEPSDFKSIEKLAVPNLTFDPISCKFTTDSDNVKIYIKNTVTNQLEEHDFISYQYSFVENAGIYEIYAIKHASEENQIDSEKSNIIHIKRLPTISNLTHRVIDGFSYLNFVSISGCEGYQVLIDDVGVQFSKQEFEGKEYLKLQKSSNELFNLAKKYEIKVIGFDNSFSSQGANYFVLSEDAKSNILTVERLSSPSLLQDDNKVYWENVVGASFYEFELVKDNQVLDHGSTNLNYISKNNLLFGDYKLKVFAKGNESEYLNSLTGSEIEFKIIQALDTPQLRFDKQTQKLIVSSVENAEEYVIYLNDEEFEILSQDLELSIADVIAQSGVYTFKAVARSISNSAENNGDGNLLNSLFASVKIEKLALPQFIKVDANKVLEVKNIPASASNLKPYQIFVNEVETEEFDEHENFVVKVKFLAQMDEGNNYYIDSEVSTFNISRLNKVDDISLSNYTLNWSSVDEAESYIIRFENGERKFETQSVSNSIELTQDEQLKEFIEEFGNGAKVYISAYIQAMELGTSDQGKISSIESDGFLLQRLTIQTPFEITPEEGFEQNYVIVSWNEVANATSYNVSYNDNVSNITSNTFQSPTIDEMAIIKVQAIAENFLPSVWNVVKVQRLPKVESIDVLQDESILIDALEGVGEILVNDSIELSNFSLNMVDQNLKTISLRNIASGFLNEVYYINSLKTNFNFKRFDYLPAPEIENNLIIWERLADADGYELKIVEGDRQELIILNDNQISLSDERILNFVTNSAFNYDIFVRGLVSPYTLAAGSIGYLSGNFKDGKQLSKLAKVTNLKVEAEDEFEQKNVIISFEGVENADVYEIYVNGELFAKTFQTSLSTDKFQFDETNGGIYEIAVKATRENYLSSEISSSVITRRLAPIAKDAILVSKEGVLSYSQKLDSVGYVTYYELAQNVKSSLNKTTKLSHDYSEVVAMDYSGIVVFNVLALGDGQNTLSSEFTSYDITKLSKPQVQLFGDHLEISSDANATNVLTVKFKTTDEERVILTKTLTQGQKFMYPQEWDQLGDGSFVFEVYSTCEGYLNSNTNKLNQERLASVTFDGFYRDSFLQDKLFLQIDANELKSREDITYILSVENTSFEDNLHKPDNLGKITYEITGDFDKALKAGNFKISIIATSGSSMNSKACEIAGKRLAQVSNIFSNNGVLTWTKSLDVSTMSYLLRLGYNNGTDDVEERFVKDLNENFDLLTGVSGQIVANIKNIGNVGNSLVSEDIVLDSAYRQNSTGEENFTAFKLSILENLVVKLGEFAFDEVELANGYRAKCEENGVEYDLIKDEQNSSYSSSTMYNGNNKLLTNVLYTIRVQATSNQNNILYSDYSNPIKVKILENPNTPETVSYSWSKSDVNAFTIKFNKVVNSSGTLIVLSSTKLNARAMAISNYATLNCDDANFLGGDYSVSLKAIGNSTLVENEYYCLSSKEVKVRGFKKLDAPNILVENGKLVWEPVDNANAYYIYYYNVTNGEQLDYNQFIESYTEYSTPTNQTYFIVPDNFGARNENINYYFGVRAVYNVEGGEVSPSYISTINKETEDDILLQEVTKLKAPDEISLIDGSLIWKASGLDYDVSIDIFNQTATLNAGIHPFVYSDVIEELEDNIITLKFVDNQNVERRYNIEAYRLFRPELADGKLFELIAPSLGLDKDFEFGWPNLSFLAGEIGDLTPGAHYVSLSQQGNSENWLTSMFNIGFEVYLPHAPKASISNYILSWDEVFLPQDKNYSADYKYFIISENNLGKRSIVYKTNELFVDLRELVNSENLKPGNHKLYVMVSGDSSYYLNGFVSNALDVLVLPNITASILDGILSWDTVSQTRSYKLKLTTTDSNYNFEQEFEVNSWDFSQLQESDLFGNILTYSLTMQALGNGTSVISGKETDLGKITKLKTPNTNVLNGVFVWENVLGNCGYQVLIGTQNEPLTQKLSIDKNIFESQIEGFNTYNFRTLGSTFANLSQSSTSYAISNFMNNSIAGVLLPSVEDARTYEGNLVWKNVKDYSNASVNGYKISFDNMNFYPELYLDSNEYITIEGQQYVLSEINQSYKPGDYKVYIQAYSSSTYIRAEDGVEYNLLLSKITNQSTIEFYKLKPVQNITVENGIISWDKLDEKSDAFNLSFMIDNEEYSFKVNGNVFDSALLSDDDLQIYKNLVPGKSYTIKIQTLGDSLGILNSDVNLDNGYEILSEIGDVVYLEGGEEGFIIRWKLFDFVKEITDYNYVIRYSNMDGETFILDTRTLNITKGYDGEEECYFGEIDGSVLLTPNSNLLKYSITAIPVTQNKIISSKPSMERTVAPPMSISSGISYSEKQREISWTYDAAGSDVSFRIVDELVTLDQNNNVIVLERNTYLSKQTSFYPKEIGLHRISISVVLTGGNVASSYVYFYSDEIREGLVRHEDFILQNNGVEIPFTLINNNLFTSGEGSKDSPYIITSEEDFLNMNYRYVKPTYFGGEEVFYFSLSQNLTVSESISQFDNVFNGNNYEIYYTLTNNSSASVSLFNTLGTRGKIENLQITANIIQNNLSSITSLYLSALCVYNYGTIENCQVNNFNYSSSLNKSIDFYFGGIACNNYGVVTRCINKANISYDGITAQSEIRSSNLYIGGIVYNNTVSPTSSRIYGKVIQCGNEGNIKVYSKTFVIGGVVAFSHVSSNIEQCYNKGNIDAFITTTGNAISYVGGLVGHNQGMIKNSYSVANYISVDLNSQTRTIYVGGLVGYASNQNGIVINNCYSSTVNLQVLNDERGTSYVGLLVGYSNAQNTTKQTISYYNQSTGLVAINNAPSGFTAQPYTGFDILLSNLNSTDYVYAQGTSYPILQWEIE